MSVALRGNLQDFGIADVFQLVGQQRKTGLLEITAEGQTMRLAFDAGGIVWARPGGVHPDAMLGQRLVRCGLLTQSKLDELQQESEVSARSLPALAVETGAVSSADVREIEDLVTNDTIFVVLRWSTGSFDFSAQPVEHKRPVESLLAAEQILMDGLRMVDEWQSFAALVPSGDTVFRRCGLIESLPQQGEERRKLEKMFALVDGQQPVERVVDLSRLGLFEATRTLAELRQHSLIDTVTKRVPASRGRVDRPRRGVVANIRWLLAAAFPLLLLAIVVSRVLEQSPSGGAPGVFPIERSPLERARASFEKRRLTHALEAQKMLTGRYPESLAEVGRNGLAGSGALTPSDAADYYYARRGNGILLLAPER
jgi:hypothetical protein